MLGLEAFAAEFGWVAFAGAGAALAAGGFTKGVIGFALPLVALSTMGSFLPFEVAVALLILPTLVSNAFQSLRNGFGAAWLSLLKYRLLLAILMVMIALCAQLLTVLPPRALFALLGVAITVFGASQLVGFRLRFDPAHRTIVEAVVALVAGFFGGISGIWGPPVTMYLLALNTPKVEMVRVQSLSFFAGSLVLVAAHVRSGVLDAVTVPVSAWLVLPTMAAMFLGYRVQDRLDQEVFRRVTLVVLILAGLNLLRRSFQV